MIIITAYLPDMDMDDYDGTEEIIILIEGRPYHPAITSSIGDDQSCPDKYHDDTGVQKAYPEAAYPARNQQRGA